MKKIITLIAFSLFLAGCGKQPSQTIASQPEPIHSTTDSAVLAYQKEVKQLTELSLADFKTKLAAPEPFLIYLGKPTCDYCQAFVPKLTASLADHPRTLYYFDVTEADTTPEIKELMTTLNLEYVPALLRITDSGKIIQTYDKKNEELGAFLKKSI